MAGKKNELATKSDERRKVTKKYRLSGARLIFRNFQGKGGTYNNEGDRNFGLLLPDEDAEMLENDGWPVKYLKPRQDDPDQYRQPWMKVKVKYGDYPPIVNLITTNGRVKLDEDTIGQLDWTRIANVDIVVRPYNYKPTPICPEGGVTAYLQNLYVTVDEDDFEAKYANIPYLDDDDDLDIIDADFVEIEERKLPGRKRMAIEQKDG